MSKLLMYMFLTAIITPSILMLEVDREVYICTGPKSKRYHYKKSCRGLKKCSTDIYKVSIKEAKEEGRTLCGWED